MLSLYRRLASWLSPWQTWYLVLACGIALLITGSLIFAPNALNPHALLGLSVALLSCLCCWLISALFSKAPLQPAGFFRRLFYRSGQYLLAFLLSLILFSWLLLLLRMLSLLLRHYVF
ncbi:MAG: hypothetical protein NWQ42_06680 [Alishewanella sp.]|uniref:hypothetical protein n=1 Tax=Alishewanella sp. HL-SH06 TaxID=3461144 RepID=UPI0027661835|nr:hypothetical protein [Alishewanella sp.]